jgi:hypothetical protein
MNEQEKHKDSYISTLLNEGAIERPPQRFTDNIINAIAAQSESSAYKYKPVISRTAWMIIAFIGVAAFAFLLFAGPSGGQGLDILGYSFSLDFSKIKELAGGITISFELTPIVKTSIIALFVFTFSNLILLELKDRSIFK